MKKIMIATVVLMLITSGFAKTPENLQVLKAQVMKYHDSGQYNKDIAKVIHHAKTYLVKRIQANNLAAKPKKLAIVFDIDETTLSNYSDMKRMNFGGTLAAMTKAQDKAQDPAIKPVFAFYRFAINHGVSVFFITGRKEANISETVKNLKEVGYTKWNGLILKPNDYNKSSVIPYKSFQRKKIEAEGYDIVMTVGDQYSDLKGGYADRQVKLPNPYYYIG